MNVTDVIETAHIHLATESKQIQACYKIMQQLHARITSEEEFVGQVLRQIQEGYHLAYIQDGGQVKAVAGFRFLEFLAWGKVIYIDDLVSDAKTRRKGYGSKLLQWVINEANMSFEKNSSPREKSQKTLSSFIYQTPS